MTAFPAAIAGSCAGLSETTFGPEQTLMLEGATDGRLFVLVDGAVKVLRQNVEVATIGDPGAIFGEISLLLGVPHTATVTTSDVSRFYVIEDGAAFMRDNPEVMLHISRMLALRVHLLSAYLADIKTQFADQAGHLGMVHDIICGLTQHPHNEVTLGSDRLPDPRT
jgi:CRP-like cAMP-binding protein